MNFLKELKPKMETVMSDTLYSQTQTVYRICKWINIDEDYLLSIQASSFHYCIPREYLPLDEYTHFELAVIYKGHLISDISVFNEFRRYEELIEHQDDNIFINVPKDLIEELYNWLKNI